MARTGLAVGAGWLLSAALFAGDWKKISTPYFTVVSELSESRTKAWATEFEIYRRGLDKLIPIPPAQITPVTVVLFTTDRRLKAFKPLEDGKPKNILGYFVRTPSHHFIAIAAEGARDDVRELIYHEGVHWYLSALELRVPLWLEEGLAEIFGSFTLSGNTFTVGANRPYYTRYVGIAKPMPFTKMSAQVAGEMSYNGQHANFSELFYAQSWVAAHDLLFTPGFDGWNKVRAYLQQPPKIYDINKNFEEAMGLSPAALDARTAAYLKAATPPMLKFTFDRSNISAGFALAEVPETEVDLTLGNLLVAVDRGDEAGAYLWRAAATLPNDPRPREALAEAELAKGNVSAAMEHYEAAETRGGRSYSGYFLAAQMEMRGAMASSMTRALTDDRVQDVTTNLVKSLQLNPRFLPAYEKLAVVARYFSAESEAGRLLAHGAEKYPYSALLHFGLAEQALRRGDRTAARAEAVRALALSPEGQSGARRLTNLLLAELDEDGEKAGPRAPSALPPPK